MKPQHLYASLAVVGTLVPFWQLLPFIQEHGLAVAAMFRQLFSTPVGAFFGMDVIVSSVVLWTLVYVDGRRHGVGHLWAPVLASLLIGVSLGLPLFLYMRERRLQWRVPR